MASKKSAAAPTEMPGQMELPLDVIELSTRLEEMREENLGRLIELQSMAGVELKDTAIHELRLATFIDHILGEEDRVPRLQFEIAFETAKSVVLTKTLGLLTGTGDSTDPAT